MKRRRARFAATMGACAAMLVLSGCRPAPAGPEALVPGLDAALAGIERIDIEQQGGTLALVRDGEHWRIDGAGWRADRRWLQPLLLNLAQARCDEARTADAARFARIGVAWPRVDAQTPADATTDSTDATAAADQASSNAAPSPAFARPTGRITIDVDGREQRVVVGFPHPDGGTFVRVEGAPRSCLTRVDLRLPARASEWFDPRIWAEAPEPPASLIVEDVGSAPLTLRRVGERYLTENQTIAVSPLPDALVAALLGLRQNEVRAAAGNDTRTGHAAALGDATRVLRFESPAGSGYAVALHRDGEQVWARVLAAPAAQGGGFEGREFLLPPDVANPLMASLR